MLALLQCCGTVRVGGCYEAPVNVRRAHAPLCATRGDRVWVIRDVLLKGKLNSRGFIGRVVDNAAEQDEEDWGACCELAWGQPPLRVIFGEQTIAALAHSAPAQSVPSDGMCRSDGVLRGG